MLLYYNMKVINSTPIVIEIFVNYNYIKIVLLYVKEKKIL